jgi:prevent-host-death family protein
MQVNILEAKNQLSRLIKAASSGEDVVIANRGVPVARLVPARGQGHASTQPDAHAETLLSWLSSHPLPAHILRSHEDIEAGIQLEREAWD